MKNITRTLLLQGLLLVTFFMVHAEGVTYVEYDLGYDTLEVNEETVIYTNRTGLKRGSYSYPEKLELNIVTERNGYGILQDENGSQKGILLRNDDFAMMYFSDNGWNINSCFFAGFSETSRMLLQGLQITSSGYLVEQTTKYKPLNLFDMKIHNPWVESADDYGIGEYIELPLSGLHGESLFKASGLYLVNGFVSFSNQTLYEKNSRIKRLKIVDMTSGSEWYQDIEDSPFPQFIDFKGHEGNNIRLMIDDVYPGTKYMDTCVTNIILVR